VLDFYCPSEKLAVELDGEPHYTKEGIEYDEKRSSFLDSHGICVLRFENYMVFDYPNDVLLKIRSHFNNGGDISRIDRQPLVNFSIYPQQG
jgi:very-short-patch-repair endonuclease